MHAMHPSSAFNPDSVTVQRAKQIVIGTNAAHTNMTVIMQFSLTRKEQTPDPQAVLSHNQSADDQQWVQFRMGRLDGWVQQTCLHKVSASHHGYDKAQLPPAEPAQWACAAQAEGAYPRHLLAGFRCCMQLSQDRM